MGYNHTQLSHDDLFERERLKNIVNDGRFKIALFGSARLKKEDILYEEIRNFSFQLASKKYDLITGGGPGAMEAASLGHHLACEGCDDSQSIGINIELPFEQKPNKYLDITESASTFSARLDTFMVLSHMFVVTPGGIGTLLELFYTWQLMQVGHICRAPIILVGSEYADLKKFIQKSVVERGFLSEQESALAIQVETFSQAHTLIDEAYKCYETLGPNACVNIQQYIAGAKALGIT